MNESEKIGKIVSWSRNKPGEAAVGVIKHRVSACESRLYTYGSANKKSNYTPVVGDRVSFILKSTPEGIQYASNIQFIMTGVT